MEIIRNSAGTSKNEAYGGSGCGCGCGCGCGGGDNDGGNDGDIGGVVLA